MLPVRNCLRPDAFDGDHESAIREGGSAYAAEAFYVGNLFSYDLPDIRGKPADPFGIHGERIRHRLDRESGDGSVPIGERDAHDDAVPADGRSERTVGAVGSVRVIRGRIRFFRRRVRPIPFGGGIPAVRTSGEHRRADRGYRDFFSHGKFVVTHSRAMISHALRNRKLGRRERFPNERRDRKDVSGVECDAHLETFVRPYLEAEASAFFRGFDEFVHFVALEGGFP